MRQLFSWRTWAAVGALLVLITAVQLATGRGPRGLSDDSATRPAQRRTETVASVMAID